MEIKGFPPRGDKALTASTYSYIDTDGILHTGVYAEPVMVNEEADLDLLTPDNCVPGTMAFVAGFGTMWQLDAAGSWQEIS